MEIVRKKIDNLVKENKSHRRVLHQQEDINVGYDYYASIFSLCCKDILMIDFDNKDGWYLDNVIERLKQYTKDEKAKGIEYLFEIYETDRGVHAFIINRLIEYTSEEALNIMINLKSDEIYIGYVEVRGYCVRLNPKINMLNTDEFIAKPTDIIIGYGEEIPYIHNVLQFHLNMIDFFISEYKHNKSEYIQKRYIPELDSLLPTPSEEIFKRVKDKIIYHLKEYDIYGKGEFITNYRNLLGQTVIELYAQSDMRIGFDIYNGIWHFCTPGMLMVDFDLDDKLEAIEILENFCELHRNYNFRLYETDNGVHAYVVNKYIYYSSEESIWLLKTLTPNNMSHIQTVIGYSHCIRVGPKIWRDGILRKKATIQNSIVERKCLKGICSIGEGDPLPEFEKARSSEAI